MAVARRLLGTGVMLIVALGLTSQAAQAAGGPSRAAGAARVFQVSLTKVNPHVQKNLMLAGQNLTASTQVRVGGYATATVEAPDAYHLLVRLPEELPQGTYLVEATNEAGTTVAEEPVVVQLESGPNRMTILFGSGFMALLMLVARAARPSVLR